MSIEIIKDHKGPFGNPNLIRQVQVTVDGEHFLVSSSGGFGLGDETMAFSCKPNGKVIDWTEVAGGWHNGVVIPADATPEEVIGIIKDLFVKSTPPSWKR
jgi:hypothetical protein